MRRILAMFLAALALFPVLANAQQPRWRDPFARRAAASSAVADPAEGDGAVREQAREPELRAIIYDRSKSLVNIDGRVLALGDSIDGFKLVQVAERSVMLAKAGKRITLTLTKDGQR